MTRGKSLSFALATALAGVVVAGWSSVAHAQYQAPPPGYGPPPGYAPPPPPPPAYQPPPPRYYGYGYPRPRVYREGLIIGFGLGGGGITSPDQNGVPCGDACGGAFAFEGHLGVMLNPRLGIMGDFWVNDHPISNSDSSTVQSIYTLALQYWVNDIFWLKGGLGGGHISVTSASAGDLGSDSGFALMGAVGIELVQSPIFALDLHLRVGHGFYSPDPDATNWALMVGFTWF
jgi:Outer membrane protein beta-barrel domain